MPKPQEDFNFMAALKQTLLDEGGDKLTDDPDDPGGRTKFGITQRFLTAIGGGKVDDLDETKATAIYYQHWWLEYHFDELAVDATSVAAKVFNFAVNAGPKAAFLCLQRAMIANDIPIKDDGVLGPITRGVLATFLKKNGANARCLYVALKSEIAGYYRDLDKPKYEAGWIARAYR